MAQQPHNPLLHPPFFLIQGINPASPVSTQTEQIDQLNTLLLQEIDANFAKFHQVVTSRILPEIKRFAIAGEPTREAAQFWKKFYEAASGVRSTIEGESTVHDQSESHSTYDDHASPIARDEDQSFSTAHEEGSFIFGKGATASTPLGKKQYTGNESWEDSIESPFDKNDRQLRELKIGGGDGYDDESGMTPSYPTGYGIPGRDDSSMSSSPSIRPAEDRSHSSRPISSTPRAATRAPVRVTDLRTTPLNAKFPKLKSKPQQSGLGSKPATRPTFDDSDDDLLAGMSPLRTTNFGPLPPRVQAVNAIVHDKTRTPRKGPEADTIFAQLISEIEEGVYVDSPGIVPDFIKAYSPTARYSTSAPGQSTSTITNNHNPLNLAPPVRETRKSMANTSFGSDIVTGSGPLGQSQDDDSDDSFSSDDSGTVPPPGDYRSDFSYTTNTPGATARYGGAGEFTETMHPGAGPSDEEVFGGPSGSAASRGKAPFGLMRQDEMYTYNGGDLAQEGAPGETPVKKTAGDRWEDDLLA